MGGAAQLGAQLKLLKELCAAAKGPSQLTKLLQAVHSIIEQAGGSDKVHQLQFPFKSDWCSVFVSMGILTVKIRQR